MKGRFLITLTTLFIITVSACAQDMAPERVAKMNVVKIARHRVVVQLASADSMVHKSLINQLGNLKEVWGDTVEVEVVVHGPGLDFLMSSRTTQKEGIRRLSQKGINFVACEFTLKQRKVEKSELMPVSGYTPYGLVEIIRRQEEGWSYIKAGF